MSLFLNEDIMRHYLLSEAPAPKEEDPDEEEEEKDEEPKEKASTDNKDTADAEADEKDADADTEEEPTDEEPAEDEAGGPPSDDFGAGGGDEEPTDDAAAAPVATNNAAPMSPKLQAAVAKQGLEIPDTPNNRTWLLEKYQEVIKIYENLLEFVSTLTVKFPNDGKRMNILTHMTSKIESNLEMLNKALDDQIFAHMDVAALFALYKIYFNDATSVQRTIKLIVSYQNVK